MRYSLKPKYRKYVQGYGFLSFPRKFGDQYGQKVMNAEKKHKKAKNKTGTDAAKTDSKRVVQKPASQNYFSR